MINSLPNCIVWEESLRAEAGSNSNLSIAASHKQRAGTMKGWGNSYGLHKCRKDLLPVDAHVKAPQIPPTNHYIHTYKPGDQAHFTHWKILWAWPECIPSASPWGSIFFFSSSSSFSGSSQLCKWKHNHRYLKMLRLACQAARIHTTHCVPRIWQRRGECWLCAQCHLTSSAPVIYFLLTPEG